MDISKHVFHFTGAEALLGIVTRRELWASSIGFLNDKFDGQLPNRRLREMSDSPEVFFGSQQGFAKKHLEALKLSLGQKHSVTVSFSGHPRSLPQFRMYCPADGGYAIGFPTEYLAGIGTVVKCDYSAESLESWCKTYVANYCQAAAAIDNPSKTANDICEELARNPDFLDDRMLASLRFKSDEFIHESEVRLYKHIQPDRFRISKERNYVVPYHILNLPNDPIDVVLVVGPSRDDSLANESIAALGQAARIAGTKWQFHVTSIGEIAFRV